MALRRKRPEVLALATATVFMAALAYWSPVVDLAHKIPGIGDVSWDRSLVPLCLGLAALAGIGLDEVVRTPRSLTVRLSLTAGFGLAAALVTALWLFGRNDGIPSLFHAILVHDRDESFVWPTAGVVVGLVGAGLLWWRSRTARAVALGFLVVEGLFLVTAGTIEVGSSTNGVSTTPAVSTLQRLVGTSIVADGGFDQYCDLGISPDANILFHVHELNLYDPIVPLTYFTDRQRESSGSSGPQNLNLFCPVIRTVAEARAFGVSYILEIAGQPAPSGATFVARLATPSHPYPSNAPPSSEDLYRVPGSGQAVLTTVPMTHVGAPRPTTETQVRISDPDPAKWSLVTDAPTSRMLVVHLTDVPGWRATLDGHPLALKRISVFTMEARVPAGRHVIELAYWPSLFSVGLLVASLALVALVGGVVVECRSRRGPPTA